MRRREAGEASSGGGIGLAGMIFVVFLALKLAEVGVVADWSWWWVTSPLWISAALVALVLVALGVFTLVDDSLQRRRQAAWRKRHGR